MYWQSLIPQIYFDSRSWRCRITYDEDNKGTLSYEDNTVEIKKCVSKYKDHKWYININISAALKGGYNVEIRYNGDDGCYRELITKNYDVEKVISSCYNYDLIITIFRVVEDRYIDDRAAGFIRSDFPDLRIVFLNNDKDGNGGNRDDKSSKKDTHIENNTDEKDNDYSLVCHKSVLAFNSSHFKSAFLSPFWKSQQSLNFNSSLPIFSINRFSNNLKNDIEVMECFLSIMYTGCDKSLDMFKLLSGTQKCTLIKIADQFLCERVLLWICEHLDDTIFDSGIASPSDLQSGTQGVISAKSMEYVSNKVNLTVSKTLSEATKLLELTLKKLMLRNQKHYLGQQRN